MENLLEFGTIGKLILGKDWSKTSLGSIYSWPHILKESLEMILSSDFPMTLFCGRDLVQISNDAFLKMLCIDTSKLEDIPTAACEQLFASENELLLGFFNSRKTIRTVDKRFYVKQNGNQYVERYFTHSYRYLSMFPFSVLTQL